VLYGAGNLGRKTLRGLRKNGADAIAFADANPALSGKQVEGVPVFSPEEAVRRFGKEAVFVVCVWHPDRKHGVQDIMDRLSGIGVERVTSFVPLFWRSADGLLPYYLWDLPSRLLAESAAIRETCSALQEESREQFTRELRMRLYGDFAVMNAPLQSPQYFAHELFELSSAECFVDCGAFDGDTMREFVGAVDGRFRRLIGFEADATNFQRLEKYVAAQPQAIRERVVIHEAAVGRSSGTLRFAATAGTDAAVSASGDAVIPSVCLDDALAGEVPTMVKMDIEGSEMEALEGASRVIRAYAPISAICVYHCPDHLWAIPLWLKKAQPVAKLFLKSYCVDGWETVCYAVPSERTARGGNGRNVSR